MISMISMISKQPFVGMDLPSNKSAEKKKEQHELN
jgi:hypothetical protein